MKPKSMDLVWIVVNDIKKALKFYTETVGLKLKEFHEEFGWAELEGHHGGARIGLAQSQLKEDENVKPGQNAVMTFTVDNLASSIESLKNQGANLVGPMEEIPGHVKMQMVSDSDGNRFQVVEVCHTQNHSCCGGH